MKVYGGDHVIQIIHNSRFLIKNKDFSVCCMMIVLKKQLEKMIKHMFPRLTRTIFTTTKISLISWSIQYVHNFEYFFFWVTKKSFFFYEYGVHSISKLKTLFFFHKLVVSNDQKVFFSKLIILRRCMSVWRIVHMFYITMIILGYVRNKGKMQLKITVIFLVDPDREKTIFSIFLRFYRLVANATPHLSFFSLF